MSWVPIGPGDEEVGIGEAVNKPLPKIVCNKCNMSQEYRNQSDCIHCGQRLNNWSVATQLQPKEQK